MPETEHLVECYYVHDILKAVQALALLSFGLGVLMY